MAVSSAGAAALHITHGLDVKPRDSPGLAPQRMHRELGRFIEGRRSDISLVPDGAFLVPDGAFALLAVHILLNSPSKQAAFVGMVIDEGSKRCEGSESK